MSEFLMIAAFSVQIRAFIVFMLYHNEKCVYECVYECVYRK